jgi:hypothetical protein
MTVSSNKTFDEDIASILHEALRQTSQSYVNKYVKILYNLYL